MADLPEIAFSREIFRAAEILALVLVLAAAGVLRYFCPRQNKVCRAIPGIILGGYFVFSMLLAPHFFDEHFVHSEAPKDTNSAWVRLDSSGFYCSSWRVTVPWPQITHLAFGGSRQYRVTVWLSEQALTELYWTDFVRRRGRVDCEISSLDTPPSQVEASIRTYWQRYAPPVSTL